MGFGIKSRLENLLRHMGYELLRLDRPAGAGFLRDADLLGIYLRPVVSGGRKIRIIQIGANDGYTGDPIVEILRADNVEAVLIEPLPDIGAALSEKYANNQRIRVEIAAVSDRSGSLDLFTAIRAEDGRIADSSISSFSRQHVEKHIADRRHVEAEVFGTNPHVKRLKVQCYTIEQVLKRAGWSSADVLVTDTEGYDAVIINNILNAYNFFEVIYFEHVNIPTDEYVNLSSRLDKSGYALVTSGMNTLAVKQTFLSTIACA